MDAPEFVQHSLIRGGHAQTVAGTYLWKASAYQAAQRSVQLPDGDTVIVHDDCPKNWESSGTIAVLSHGLAGCFGSGYMRRIAEKLVAAGARSFRMDQRGCGAGARLARFANNGARSADIGIVLDNIREDFPDAQLTLVGFSLGAAMSLKLAGVQGELFKADRVVAVAPPLDFSRCSANMEQGLNRTYSRYFAKLLVRHVTMSSSLREQLSDDVKESPPRSLADFDRRVTAPLGGFRNVAHYYESASPFDVLASIAVPATIIASKDDPLVPVIDFETASFSGSTNLLLTNHGGHLGFLANRRHTRDPDWHWMDWRIVESVTRRSHSLVLH